MILLRGRHLRANFAENLRVCSYIPVLSPFDRHCCLLANERYQSMIRRCTSAPDLANIIGQIGIGSKEYVEKETWKALERRHRHFET
jgi:hypothetical protein